MVDEKEIYLRFAFYDDDELLRIVTVERAEYRPEALTAAEEVLMRRGIEIPLVQYAPGPLLRQPSRPVDGGDDAEEAARPKSPYQFIDLCVDALLLGLVIWGRKKLEDWTQTPWGSPWDDIIYGALVIGFLVSVISLRRKWRAIEWRDQPPEPHA